MATQRALGPSALRATSSTFLPVSPVEYEAVHAQLERILASPAFRNSKRYASVLKYIVERTLEGAGDQLKERIIGIEVFGRPPDYDTASDHAVRSAAAEVRKRLAQYYQEETDSAELRVELQPGSYVPRFRWSYQVAPLRPAEAPADTKLGAIVVPREQPGSKRTLRPWIAGLGLIILLCLAASLFGARSHDPVERFWGPLWSKGEVLLCVGNLAGGSQADGDTSGGSTPITLRDFHRADSEIIHVNDAITLSRIAS